MIGSALLAALEWGSAALFAAGALAALTVSAWFAIPALIFLGCGLFARSTAGLTARPGSRRAWGVGRAVADDRAS